jgi:hypothetical protein
LQEVVVVDAMVTKAELGPVAVAELVELFI